MVQPLKKRVRLAPEQKLEERCIILESTIKAIIPIYSGQATTENQKQLLETMIGAAIWYLPQSPELWTGMISREALRSLHPRNRKTVPRLVAEHQHPRKVAAGELLTMDWGRDSPQGKVLMKLYQERYGRFNYVTPRENKLLVAFQKDTVFEDPVKAYKEAGVELIPLTSELLARVKKRSKATIEKLVGPYPYDSPIPHTG